MSISMQMITIVCHLNSTVTFVSRPIFMEGHDALSKYLFKIGYKYFRISETKGNSPMKEDEEEQQLRTALLHKFSVPNYAPYHEDVWRYSFMHS